MDGYGLGTEKDIEQNILNLAPWVATIASPAKNLPVVQRSRDFSQSLVITFVAVRGVAGGFAVAEVGHLLEFFHAVLPTHTGAGA